MKPDGAMVRVVELDPAVYGALAEVLRPDESWAADEGYNLPHSRTLFVPTNSGFKKLIFVPKGVVVDSPGVADSQTNRSAT